MQIKYPKTKKIEKIDDYYGVKISDSYQWFENYSNEEVRKWVHEQEKLAYSFINKLQQKKSIQKRLRDLCRYDERTIPWEILKGTGMFFYERKKDDEKWVYYTQEDEVSKKIELLNPNIWEKDELLSFTAPSAD